MSHTIRKFWVLLCVIIVFITGTMLFKISPTYAQDIVNTLPDLSGARIYFSEVHDEASRFDRTDSGISRFAGLLELAGAELRTLEWRNGIPEDADLIILSAPGSELELANVARLWVYIQNGGKVLLVADPLDDRGRIGRILEGEGLMALTSTSMNLSTRNDMIVQQNGTQFIDVVEYDNDDNIVLDFSGDVPILQTDFMTQSVNPAHPITSNLSDETTQTNSPPNLTGLQFDGARSIEIFGIGTNTTPLIFVDNADLYAESNYERYLENGYSDYNTEEDLPYNSLILAAAFEEINGDSRFVIIGDGDFILNGGGLETWPSYSGSFVYPLNAQFLMRSVAWLLDRQPTVMTLPTPAATATATATPLPTTTPTVMPTATAEN